MSGSRGHPGASPYRLTNAPLDAPRSTTTHTPGWAEQRLATYTHGAKVQLGSSTARPLQASTSNRSLATSSLFQSRGPPHGHSSQGLPPSGGAAEAGVSSNAARLEQIRARLRTLETGGGGGGTAGRFGSQGLDSHFGASTGRGGLSRGALQLHLPGTSLRATHNLSNAGPTASVRSGVAAGGPSALSINTARFPPTDATLGVNERAFPPPEHPESHGLDIGSRDQPESVLNNPHLNQRVATSDGVVSNALPSSGAEGQPLLSSVAATGWTEASPSASDLADLAQGVGNPEYDEEYGNGVGNTFAALSGFTDDGDPMRSLHEAFPAATATAPAASQPTDAPPVATVPASHGRAAGKASLEGSVFAAPPARPPHSDSATTPSVSGPTLTTNTETPVDNGDGRGTALEREVAAAEREAALAERLAAAARRKAAALAVAGSAHAPAADPSTQPSPPLDGPVSGGGATLMSGAAPPEIERGPGEAESGDEADGWAPANSDAFGTAAPPTQKKNRRSSLAPLDAVTSPDDGFTKVGNFKFTVRKPKGALGEGTPRRVTDPELLLRAVSRSKQPAPPGGRPAKRRLASESAAGKAGTNGVYLSKAALLRAEKKAKEAAEAGRARAKEEARIEKRRREKPELARRAADRAAAREARASAADAIDFFDFDPEKELRARVAALTPSAVVGAEAGQGQEGLHLARVHPPPLDDPTSPGRRSAEHRRKAETAARLRAKRTHSQSHPHDAEHPDPPPPLHAAAEAAGAAPPRPGGEEGESGGLLNSTAWGGPAATPPRPDRTTWLRDAENGEDREEDPPSLTLLDLEVPTTPANGPRTPSNRGVAGSVARGTDASSGGMGGTASPDLSHIPCETTQDGGSAGGLGGTVTLDSPGPGALPLVSTPAVAPWKARVAGLAEKLQRYKESCVAAVRDKEEAEREVERLRAELAAEQARGAITDHVASLTRRCETRTLEISPAAGCGVRLDLLKDRAGARITGLQPHGAVSAAGGRCGDVILAIDAVPVYTHSIAQIRAAMSRRLGDTSPILMVVANDQSAWDGLTPPAQATLVAACLGDTAAVTTAVLADDAAEHKKKKRISKEAAVLTEIRVVVKSPAFPYCILLGAFPQDDPLATSASPPGGSSSDLAADTADAPGVPTRHDAPGGRLTSKGTVEAQCGAIVATQCGVTLAEGWEDWCQVRPGCTAVAAEAGVDVKCGLLAAEMSLPEAVAADLPVATRRASGASVPATKGWFWWDTRSATLPPGCTPELRALLSTRDDFFAGPKRPRYSALPLREWCPASLPTQQGNSPDPRRSHHRMRGQANGYPSTPVSDEGASSPDGASRGPTDDQGTRESNSGGGAAGDAPNGDAGDVNSGTSSTQNSVTASTFGGGGGATAGHESEDTSLLADVTKTAAQVVHDQTGLDFGSSERALATVIHLLLAHAPDPAAAEEVVWTSLTSLAKQQSHFGGTDADRLSDHLDQILGYVEATEDGAVVDGDDRALALAADLDAFVSTAAAADADVVRRVVREWEVPAHGFGVSGAVELGAGQGSHQAVGVLAAAYDRTAGHRTKFKIIAAAQCVGGVSEAVYDAVQSTRLPVALAHDVLAGASQESKGDGVGSEQWTRAVLTLLNCTFQSARPLPLASYSHLDGAFFRKVLGAAVSHDLRGLTEQLGLEDDDPEVPDLWGGAATLAALSDGQAIAHDAIAVLLAVNNQLAPCDPHVLHHFHPRRAAHMGAATVGHSSILDLGHYDLAGGSGDGVRVSAPFGPVAALSGFSRASEIGTAMVLLLNRGIEPCNQHRSLHADPTARHINSVLKFVGDVYSWKETGLDFLYLNDLFVLVHVLCRELSNRGVDGANDERAGYLWALWGVLVNSRFLEEVMNEPSYGHYLDAVRSCVAGLAADTDEVGGNGLTIAGLASQMLNNLLCADPSVVFGDPTVPVAV